MSETIPLRQPESVSLELMAKAVLADPATVGAEVVAMLNSLDPGGAAGEIWIGVDDPARGWAVQPIDDAERERQRLRDYLVDSIEPAPDQGMVSVATVPVAPRGGSVLVVRVQPQEVWRRPFALVRHEGGGRLYLRRFGDRIVPMSRSEIAAAFEGTPHAEAQRAEKALRQELASLAAQPQARLWLALEPQPGGEIDFARVERTDLLVDPTCTGTPRSSFNVLQAGHFGQPRRKRHVRGGGGLYLGNHHISLRLTRSGGLRFFAALDELSAGQVPFVEEAKLLSPERLLGYTISLLRLAAGLLKDDRYWQGDPPREIVWAWFAVLGLEGWGLLPGDLTSWSRRRQVRRYKWPNFVPESPLTLSTAEVLQDADRCGLRLVRLLYEAFGLHGAEDLPTLAR